MSAFSDFSQAAGRIYRERGDAQARNAQQKGQIWAGTLSNLSELPQVLAKQREARTRQQLQEQEMKLRAQELQQRGELGQAELELRRQQLAAKENPLVGQKLALEVGLLQHEALARTLNGANEANWPERRRMALAVAGPQAADDLPEAYPGEEAINAHIAAGQSLKDQLEAKRKELEDAAKNVKTREVKVYDPETKTETTQIVEDKPGQSFPVAPPAQSVANPNKETLALRAAQGDQEAIAALKMLETQGAERNPTEWSVLMQAAQGDANRALQLQRQQQQSGTGGRDQVWVKRGGNIIPIPKGSAQPGDEPYSPTQTRTATGVQNKTLGFFNRAKQADDDMQKIEPQIERLGYLDQQRMKRAPNFAQTQLGQSYNQAQRAFTEARLRKDSGAAIPPQEFENDRQTYFAQPGDSPSTAKQKARARAAVLASLAFEAGAALEGFYGDEAPSLIESYKARSTGGAPADTKKNPFR